MAIVGPLETAVSDGDGISMLKLSRLGTGKFGLDPGIVAATAVAVVAERGESPVDDGDMLCSLSSVDDVVGNLVWPACRTPARVVESLCQIC